MQKIERYGVIALVFLLVTIVAVSFWGDSKSPGFWSRLTGRGAKKDAPTDQTANMIPPASSTERAIDGSLPLTANDASATNVSASASVPNAAQPATAVPGTAMAVTKDPWTNMASAPPEIANQGSVAPPAPTLTNNALVSAGSSPSAVHSPAPTGQPYTVQKGDSLIRIASRMLGSGSRWPEIQTLNAGLDPKTLRPGMKIVLPASAKLEKSGSATAASPEKHAPTNVKPAATNGSGTYVVRAGDTLRAIATRTLGNGDRWKEIVSANPGLDPKHLLVGKSIRVPHGTTDGARTEDTRTAAARTSAARAPVLADAQPRSDPDRPHVR